VAAVAVAEAAGAAAGLTVTSPVTAAVGPQGGSQSDREVGVALLPRHGAEWCGGSHRRAVDPAAAAVARALLGAA